MGIKEFLLNNEEQLTDYFERVIISHEKTEIKAGWNGNNIAITFLIKGPLDRQITSYKEKIEALFNTSTNIDGLDEKIKEFSKGHKFDAQAPFVKISRENQALVHGFSFSIRKQKDKQVNQ